jgi:hypothetical protein
MASYSALDYIQNQTRVLANLFHFPKSSSDDSPHAPQDSSGLVYRSVSDVQGGATISHTPITSSKDLRVMVQLGQQEVYTTLRIQQLPLAFRLSWDVIPPRPRTMTNANGINSGGICLIFCHVGRNLIHQP